MLGRVEPRLRDACERDTMRYTVAEMNDAWAQDQIRDAELAERQAASGDFDPALWSVETLLAHAAECRQKAGQPAPRFDRCR